MIPTLLLSPDGSRDRNGPVTPTVGSGITVVPGQYGNAWDIPETGAAVRSPQGIASTIRGTMIVRLFFPDDTAYRGVMEIGSYSIGDDIRIVKSPSGNNPSGIGIQTRTNGTSSYTGAVVSSSPRGRWGAVGATWDTTTLRTVVPGIASSGGIRTVTPTGVEDQPMYVGSMQGATSIGIIESVLVYDTPLSDAEIEHISTMPTAWTWESLLPKLGGVHVGYKPDTLGVSRTIRTE